MDRSVKVLVILSHYYKPEINGVYSSTNPAFRELRQAALEEAVFSWRLHYGECSTLDIARRKYVTNPTVVEQLDIGVLVNDEHHLLNANLIEKYKLKMIPVKTDNPRMLPFAAHNVMADFKNAYDWFVYSEDDLAIRDSLLFHKLTSFQNKFGPKRLLQPHRFEVNKEAIRFKTYIDGDLRLEFIKPLIEKVEDPLSSFTTTIDNGYEVTFTRALNPHSGFFALSAKQLQHWVTQKHFMDMDCSFMSPLESAATLGILKTFSIFKSAVPNLNYLEIEHLDHKFSTVRTEY